MNTFNKNLFRQKIFKCAVMIIILLQAACAANVTMLGGGPNNWTAPNPSKLAASGAGDAFICRMDMPGELHKSQPTTAIHFPQPLSVERLGEPVLDEETELIVAAVLPIIEFIIALSRCDGCFNIAGIGAE